MSAPREIFLFFLTDTASGKSYFLDPAGNVQLDNNPTPIQSPDGWMDCQVSFGRNTKYFGINRSYTNPLKFSGDGAQIIRKLFYMGRGVETPLSLIILKWNDETDIYEQYYKGGVDLSKIEDDAAGFVTVNLLESGLLQLLKAHENDVIEIPCDGSIPENVPATIDGILFNDVYNYIFPAIDLICNSADNWFTPPLIFQSAEGDSIGIIRNDQSYDQFANPVTYCQSSANYIFQSIAAITIHITGQLKFTWSTNQMPPGGMYVAYRTSKDGNVVPADRILFNQVPVDGSYTLSLDKTITLAANEKLFLIVNLADNTSHNFTMHIQESSLKLAFDSKYHDTAAWFIRPADLFNLLVKKITGGKYEGVSTLLQEYGHLWVTSGMALRNIEGAVIKISLSDFFNSFNAILNAAIGPEKINAAPGERLFLEKKTYVYDSSVVTMSLGEVSELKISLAEDQFFNNLKIGYPDQKYDEKQGRLEYNATAEFSAPITKIIKGLELISKIRTDSYGIEYTRYLSPGNNTVNNSSDNDVFILCAEEHTVTIAAQGVLIDTAGGQGYFAVPGIAPPQFQKNRKMTVSGTGFNNRVFTISDIQIVTGGYNVVVFEPVVTEATDCTFAFTEGRPLRETYDSITGLINPDTAYNIKDLTPKRMLLKHADFLGATLYNQVPAQIKWLTSSKNSLLSTTKDGSTVIEKADVPVSSLGTPLFYPVIFNFSTKVPLGFVDILSGAANGHIEFTYNGKTFYGFPMEVSAKPALNESQTWKLLCSPKTNPSDLVSLDIDGLNFLDLMGYATFVPHLCPVKFVPLNLVYPAQYNSRSMDNDWFTEQIKFWAHRKNYFQKWQPTDIISLQCITNGLGPVQVEILDASGKSLQTIVLDPVVTSALAAPREAYQCGIALTGLSGIYYLLLTAGTGGTTTKFISEGLHVKDNWPMTRLIEYRHNRNKQSVIFSEGYHPSFRVECWISDFTPDAKFSAFEDQPADIEIINGIPFRKFKLNIAINDGVPDWVADKISRMLLLSDCTIDGIGYARNLEAKFEAQSTSGNPKRWWAIEIRESKNRDGITLTTDGVLDENLTVVYNINTKAFGDGPGADNIVEVTIID
jgi:hypothetical protein